MNNEVRDNLRESYNAFAQQREAESIQDWKIEERANFLSWLTKEHKSRLLEIGPGPGKDSQFFKNQGLDIVCIDLSREMVKLCQSKGLTAYVMDMADLQFPKNSFDAVYALNSLLHLHKAEMPTVLKSINEVLEPGGLFFLGVYGGFDFEGTREKDNYIPKRFFSFYADEAIERLISTIFEIVYFKTITLAETERLHFQSFILRKRGLTEKK
jgi:SAM-dependent methyltransferase